MNTIKKGDKGQEVKVLQRALHLIDDGVFGPITEEAVKSWQKSHGLVADGVVGQKTWLSLGIEDLYPKLSRSRRSINEIIVHCTATPEGRKVTVDEIRKWHLARGFADIGYHYVVDLEGNIREGRNVNKVGAHCTNHNSHSIGVVYVGGLAKDGKTAKDTRTGKQKESLVWLLKGLKELYPNASIHGHNTFANKSCPCFNAEQEYKTI